MSERERLREIESIRERETQDGSMCKRRGGGGETYWLREQRWDECEHTEKDGERERESAEKKR